MDHQLGPRLPNKRNEAYESIFGRPVAAHHQTIAQAPTFAFSQTLAPQPNGQPYHYPSHQYQSTLDRRPSYSPSVHAQHYQPGPGPQAGYRQPYYPSTS